MQCSGFALNNGCHPPISSQSSSILFISTQRCLRATRWLCPQQNLGFLTPLPNKTLVSLLIFPISANDILPATQTFVSQTKTSSLIPLFPSHYPQCPISQPVPVLRYISRLATSPNFHGTAELPAGNTLPLTFSRSLTLLVLPPWSSRAHPPDSSPTHPFRVPTRALHSAAWKPPTAPNRFGVSPRLTVVSMADRSWLWPMHLSSSPTGPLTQPGPVPLPTVSYLNITKLNLNSILVALP